MLPPQLDPPGTGFADTSKAGRRRDVDDLMECHGFRIESHDRFEFRKKIRPRAQQSGLRSIRSIKFGFDTFGFLDRFDFSPERCVDDRRRRSLLFLNHFKKFARRANFLKCCRAGVWGSFAPPGISVTRALPPGGGLGGFAPQESPLPMPWPPRSTYGR